MFLHRLIYPFLAPDDMGGGGGGAPTGDPGGAPAAGGGAPAAPAEPTIIDLAEDAMVRIKGQEKPVKFGDYGRGLQSQFTKASQRAAQLERELQAERQVRTQMQAEAQRRQQGQGGGQPDVYDALRQLPYLTGENAVEVVQHITQQLGERDKILIGALRELKQMKALVGGLHETHQGSQFEGKISRFLKDGGHGEEWSDFAKELYVAYEGPDLDAEFPQMLADRIAGLRKRFETERESKVRAAQRVPFVPGKGAVVGPSKPLDIKPSATAREVADQLWGQWNGSET